VDAAEQSSDEFFKERGTYLDSIAVSMLTHPMTCPTIDRRHDTSDIESVLDFMDWQEKYNV